MTRRTELTALAVLSLALAACGGGGAGDSAPSPAGAPADPAAAAARALAGPPALPPAPAGLSGNVTCRNVAIGAVALDSVFVPADSACQLDGTRLVGNVTVAPGATLDARAVQLNGNLQADGAAHVALTGASVLGGSVQVKQGGHVRVEGARIAGDLQVDTMRGPAELLGNNVGGNVQVVANRGGVTVGGNRVNGNLLCKENQPAPLAFDNSAALIEEQCVVAPGGGDGGGGGGTVPPSAPLAGNVVCDGLRIGALSLDSVFVPAGARCVLEGTQLVGSITVAPGAWLAASGVRVNGNLQADGALLTELTGDSRIGGSVQLKQGGAATVVGARIGGDLQFDAMAGPLSAAGNRVGGNVQVVGNRGGVALVANVAEGALQCKENLPAPTGGGNTASSREDQCRSL